MEINVKNRIIDKIIHLILNLKNKNVPIEPCFFSKDFKYSQNITFGDYTYGNPNVIQWDEKTKLNVGKFCSIANDVKIYLGGNHHSEWATTYPFNNIPNHFPSLSYIPGATFSKGDVNIGSDVWLASTCVILSGVTIGNGAVVGANSVVSKNIGAYEIFVGNPATFVRKRFSDKHILMLNEMEWWNWDIETIINKGDLLCSSNIDQLYEFYLMNYTI